MNGRKELNKSSLVTEGCFNGYMQKLVLAMWEMFLHCVYASLLQIRIRASLFHPFTST